MPYYIGDLERDPNLENYPKRAWQLELSFRGAYHDTFKIHVNRNDKGDSVQDIFQTVQTPVS